MAKSKKENSTEIKEENKKEKKPAKAKVKTTEAEIKAVAKTEKAPRAKKEPKTVGSEKLPKLFRKTYFGRKFEKKILRKIFIDADKKLVLSLYEKKLDENGNEVYFIDPEKKVDVKTVQRLKQVSKQIKKQKGAIKLVPLFAVIIFIAAIGLGVTMFKNVIVRNALVSGMQGVFRAETNVGKVQLQIFGASLKISDIQQTNKDNPKTNLFSIENVEMNFSLPDLLKGKLHAEKLAVQGVAVGTERKKEGRLIEKKKTKEEKNTESKISKSAKEYAGKAGDKLKEMFASYNPEVIIKGIQDNLKSPSLAKNVAEDVQKQVTKWQAVPAKMEEDIQAFSKSVQNVISTDWSAINDVASLKTALETVNGAITQGQSLSDSVQKQTSEIASDTDKVKNYGKDIQNAIESDRKLIDEKIAEVMHMYSPSGITEVMTDGVQSIVYDLAGKYYPYVNKIFEMAKEASANKDPEVEAKKAAKKAQKKAKKQARKRLKGRTIYYRKDTVPKLLIDEIAASGYEKGSERLLFSGNAKNITSDQNMINKSTSLDANFLVLGRENSASLVLDGREKSTQPLLSANYNGKDYPVSANAEVFNLTSTSDITAMISADSISNFTVGGILDMNITEMTGMDFEPAAVCNIYKKSLKEIKNLTLGFGIGIDENGDMNVEIKNMEKLSHQLVDPVVAALTSELSTIAASAKDEAIKVLSEKTGIASEKLAQWTDISTAVNAAQDKVNELQKNLEAKKNEISEKIVSQTKDAATNAAKDALKNAGLDTEALSNDKAKEALKGLKSLKF